MTVLLVLVRVIWNVVFGLHYLHCHCVFKASRAKTRSLINVLIANCWCVGVWSCAGCPGYECRFWCNYLMLIFTNKLHNEKEWLLWRSHMTCYCMCIVYNHIYGIPPCRQMCNSSMWILLTFESLMFDCSRNAKIKTITWGDIFSLYNESCIVPLWWYYVVPL